MIEKKSHHSLALIYYLLNQYEEAFNIWIDLCDRKLEDKYFPGFAYVVDLLAKLNDHQLIWKHIDWAMNVDEMKAVEIFTKRANNEIISERMRTDTILDYLKNYRNALIIYLEYLIFEKGAKVTTKSFLFCYINSFFLNGILFFC